MSQTTNKTLLDEMRNIVSNHDATNSDKNTQSIIDLFKRVIEYTEKIPNDSSM